MLYDDTQLVASACCFTALHFTISQLCMEILISIPVPAKVIPSYEYVHTHETSSGEGAWRKAPNFADFFFSRGTGPFTIYLSVSVVVALLW